MKEILKMIVMLLLFSSFFGCQIDPNPCSLSEKVLLDISSLDSLIKSPKIQERIRDQMMGNYNEPSLLDANVETYRFVWHSSFNGSEVYRVEKSNDKIEVTKKVFVNNQDSIGTTSQFSISEKSWLNIKDSLDKVDFWIYPTSIDRNGLDGSSWILEGYSPIKNKCTHQNYHYTFRWSPNDTTFIAMCKLLYNLKEE